MNSASASIGVSGAARPDTGWGQTALVWGTVSAVAFAVATLLFLVETTGMLAPQPVYTPTAAGQIVDEAAYHVARFAYFNQVLWNWALRDVLYFVAYLGLIPLALAVREVAGVRRAAATLTVAFLGVAAIFGCLNAIPTFANAEYWRNTGWETVPAALMVAIGRDSQALDELSRWFGLGAYAVLALGLVYLGVTCRSTPSLPRWIGPVAFVGAVLLVGLVIAAEIPGADTAYNVLGLAIGVVIAPVIAIGLGAGVRRAIAPART